jgi:DNA-binding MarR family transcriptional regulator
MPTERDILQSCACHRVRTAARAVTRAYDDALRPTGLRATQLTVLVASGTSEEGMSITALAKLMGMDRTTLTRNLRPLETEGLIEVGEEGWRRSRLLTITKKGRARLKDALPHWQKAQEGLRKKLGEKQWALMRQNFEELIRVA